MNALQLHMRPSACRMSPARFSSGLNRARSSLVKQCEASVHKVGDLVQGTVKQIKAKIVFVDLGSGERVATLHSSEISMQRVESPENVLKVDDVIKVLVLKADSKNGRIRLTTKYLEKTPGDMINNPQFVFDNAEEMADAFRNCKVKVGDLIFGTVQSMRTYGAFIDLGGGTVGLLHRESISMLGVASAYEVMKEGDQLKVLVSEIDEENGRVSLSTKELEPTPGDMINNRQAVFDNAEEMAASARS
jgi:ribosomal protein S1